jgi:hypothetical protein
LPSRADLFWRQSQTLFDHWEALLNRESRQVRRECALYRRWLIGFEPVDEDSALIRDVLLEMLAELMVDAALNE